MSLKDLPSSIGFRMVVDWIAPGGRWRRELIIHKRVVNFAGGVLECVSLKVVHQIVLSFVNYFEVVRC